MTTSWAYDLLALQSAGIRVSPAQARLITQGGEAVTFVYLPSLDAFQEGYDPFYAGPIDDGAGQPVWLPRIVQVAPPNEWYDADKKITLGDLFEDVYGSMWRTFPTGIVTPVTGNPDRFAEPSIYGLETLHPWEEPEIVRIWDLFALEDLGWSVAQTNDLVMAAQRRVETSHYEVLADFIQQEGACVYDEVNLLHVDQRKANADWEVEAATSYIACLDSLVEAGFVRWTWQGDPLFAGLSTSDEVREYADLLYDEAVKDGDEETRRLLEHDGHPLRQYVWNDFEHQPSLGFTPLVQHAQACPDVALRFEQLVAEAKVNTIRARRILRASANAAAAEYAERTIDPWLSFR